MCCFRRYFNASQSLSVLTFPINYTWNSLTYNNAFTWPTDEKGKMMGKSPELFSYSYEFLLRNCNKIYCFIKACWNLFSKSPASQAINFSLSYGDNMGAGICTQLFCFLGEHGGIKQSPFTTHFLLLTVCSVMQYLCLLWVFTKSNFFHCIDRSVHVQDSRHQWTDMCIPVHKQGRKLLSASVARYVSFQSSILCVNI